MLVCGDSLVHVSDNKTSWNDSCKSVGDSLVHVSDNKTCWNDTCKSVGIVFCMLVTTKHAEMTRVGL